MSQARLGGVEVKRAAGESNSLGDAGSNSAPDGKKQHWRSKSSLLPHSVNLSSPTDGEKRELLREQLNAKDGRCRGG